MELSEMPLVSIIIPVYNGSNYMREAIDSALNQSYSNCEVIVVNDGSTDEGRTEEIALSYGESIRYYSKRNGGVSSALNYGIKQMKGKYFSWLSHDDIYMRDKIKKQMKALLENSNMNAIVLSEISTIDKNSNQISFIRKQRLLSEKKINTWPVVLMDMLKNGTFYGCGLLIPKRLIIECGYFKEDLRFCQDYLMWMKLFINRNSLIYIKDELVALRIHDEQLTQNGRELYHEESHMVAREIVPQLEQLSSKKHNFLFYYAKDMAKYNNLSVLKKCIYSAQRKRLFSLRQIIFLKIYCIYGSIRPSIRKMYYRFFRKIATQ